jgi:oligopeptide/dipeptide ABC transporter ATP-binding protein
VTEPIVPVTEPGLRTVELGPRAVEPLISVVDLRVEYPASRAARDRTGRGRPVRAVDGVSLDVRPGEVLALVGESGSGKTTIAHALMRLVAPTSGRIVHRGRDITALRGAELRRLRRSFQLIFQDPYESLDPRQTVEEILTEPLLIHGVGVGPAERAGIVRASLASVGLTPPDEFAGRFPHQLSGGQRQRVSIAAAMVLEPELVVADEPVSMLDVSVRAGILQLMLDLRSERGFAYLFITHDLSLAWVLADRIAVLYLGRVVELGPADAVIREPRHPYTRALVSVIPVPDPRARREQVVLVGETPSPTDVPSGCRFHPRCPLRQRLGNPEICEQVDPVLEPTGAAHAAACHFRSEEDDACNRA